MTHDTHPAAAPVGYAVSQKKYAKARRRTFGTCFRTCPCGGGCILNGNVKHVYHSCKFADCGACHGEQRFRAQRAPGGAK